MGGRYLVTGVQLGLIKGALIANTTDSIPMAQNQIEEILNDQHVGSSDQDIIFDVKKASNILFGKES